MPSKIKLKYIFIIILCLLLGLSVFQFVLAAGPLTGPGGQGVTNMSGASGINSLMGKMIKLVLSVSGAFALLMFFWGGFTWITSAGDTAKIGKGKQILIWSTVGLIICIFSYTIVNLVIFALTGQ